MRIKKYNSEEPRGVYSSFLYTNAIDFLNEKISEKDLILAFNNSIEELTNFWKFGSMGDTTIPTEEMRAKADKATNERKEKELKRLQMKVEMKGQVKGRMDSSRNQSLLPQKGKTIDWYLPLKDLTWEQIQNIYCDQPVVSETQSSVQ
jgi:inorganic triphosphatase YgiF